MICPRDKGLCDRGCCLWCHLTKQPLAGDDPKPEATPTVAVPDPWKEAYLKMQAFVTREVVFATTSMNVSPEVYRGQRDAYERVKRMMEFTASQAATHIPDSSQAEDLSGRSQNSGGSEVGEVGG